MKIEQSWRISCELSQWFWCLYVGLLTWPKRTHDWTHDTTCPLKAFSQPFESCGAFSGLDAEIERLCQFGALSKTKKTWGKTIPQKVRKYPAKVRKYPQKYTNQTFWTVPFQNCPNLINNDSIWCSCSANGIKKLWLQFDCAVSQYVQVLMSTLCSDTDLQNIGEDLGAIPPTVCCP